MLDIEIKGLTKKFGNLKAIDDISFSVKHGELFGLLGPNGAGKTTVINILSTLMQPTSGKCSVAGHDIKKSRGKVRESIGIVFQEPALDGRLTGRENLEFHAMMYGLGKEERNNKIDEVLELVELKDKANIIVDNYSGGMKRRLEIARGLVQSPKVLFMDEPTIGLDAQTRRHIWDYISKLNKEEKVTMILTTHYMEEADELCQRVAIVDKGKIVAQGTPAKLKDLLGGDMITLEVSGKIESLEKALKKMKCVRKMKCVKEMHKETGSLLLTVARGEKMIPELIEMAKKNKVRVNSVNLRKPSLEDVFLHFTGKTIRDLESNGSKNFTMRRMGH